MDGHIPSGVAPDLLDSSTTSTTSTAVSTSSTDLDFDVAIIGAGISGINAAYRIQTQAPAGTRYAILEARSTLGGTWSFFRYPGIRSDSDLHTFGFAWRPWRSRAPIADAASIMEYLTDSAREAGIDDKIRYGHRLVRADWESGACAWRLECKVGEEERVLRARFVILGTGYYNYEEPLPAVIPGIERFEGKVVHPQFWPEDLDYEGKDMVIVGSGATAVTLLPNVAKTAKHVTMLQRSPSYVLSLGSGDPLGKLLHSVLPDSVAMTVNRYRWMITSYLFFYFCRTFPNAAKSLLRKATTKQLPENILCDPDFKPAYNPWEQRLCLCPDGDFYEALRSGRADVVTDRIKTVTERTIELESGASLKPDIIVTATGLKIRLAGGAVFTVDGRAINIPEKFMWKGVMLQDLPNLAFVVGYTNASWTLGADATAQLVTRLLRTMKEKGVVAAVPRLEQPEKMKSTPMLNINSTYIKAALGSMPKTGEGQWAPRSNYFADMRQATRGDIQTGLEFLYEARAGKADGGLMNGNDGMAKK